MTRSDSNGGDVPSTPTERDDQRWWYDDSPLEGPECPVCHRTDGSHVVSCGVPRYNKAWSKLRKQRADDNAARLFGKSA